MQEDRGTVHVKKNFLDMMKSQLGETVSLENISLVSFRFGAGPKKRFESWHDHVCFSGYCVI